MMMEKLLIEEQIIKRWHQKTITRPSPIEIHPTKRFYTCRQLNYKGSVHVLIPFSELNEIITAGYQTKVVRQHTCSPDEDRFDGGPVDTQWQMREAIVDLAVQLPQDGHRVLSAQEIAKKVYADFRVKFEGIFIKNKQTHATIIIITYLFLHLNLQLFHLFFDFHAGKPWAPLSYDTMVNLVYATRKSAYGDWRTMVMQLPFRNCSMTDNRSIFRFCQTIMVDNSPSDILGFGHPGNTKMIVTIYDT